MPAVKTVPEGPCSPKPEYHPDVDPRRRVLWRRTPPSGAVSTASALYARLYTTYRRRPCPLPLLLRVPPLWREPCRS